MSNSMLGFKLKSSYYENANKFMHQDAPQWIAVWVESDDDKKLWSPLLCERYKNFKFKMNVASLFDAADGKVSDGCCRIFSLIKNGHVELGEKSIACLDSDYSYISGNFDCNEKSWLNSPFVFYTYVHSKENIFIHPDGIDAIIGRALGEDINQHGIDLTKFINEVSISLSGYIYKFISLYKAGDTEGFSHYMRKFNELTRVFFNGLTIPEDLSADYTARIVNIFKQYDQEIESYISENLKSKSYDLIKDRLDEISIKDSDSLNFVRGHDIYPLIMQVYKKIENHIFKIKRGRYYAKHIDEETRKKKLRELANKRPNIEDLICTRSDTATIPIFSRVFTQLDGLLCK
ncbi:DUF4435 domain-containing protein [Serratia marcescens]|uniref:DUF4435 domain-containing protein n=1 Tax=Serratia marcescens TaxID=615 RepID=UPI0013D9C7E2|nr:DUF4435 domain-containing protein [Serratia marcescens]